MKMRCIITSFLISILAVSALPAQSGDLAVANGPESSPSFASVLLQSDEEASIQNTDVRQPSVAKAFFMSFLIPGTGELYAGSKKWGKIFLGSEVLLWASYFSAQSYGRINEKDYHHFALAHAGADPKGKDHQYYVDLENYDNIRDYNDAKLKQRDVNALYPETDEYDWQWDSDASRKKLEDMRVSTDAVFRGSLYLLGGVFLNHVISGIDAARIARSAVENQKPVQVGMIGLPGGGVVFSLTKQF